MFWDTMAFYMKLLKGKWEENQQEGEEEFKCYIIWQMMTAMLHSNDLQRMEKDEDTENGCQKSAVQQKTTEYWWRWWCIWCGSLPKSQMSSLSYWPFPPKKFTAFWWSVTTITIQLLQKLIACLFLFQQCQEMHFILSQQLVTRKISSKYAHIFWIILDYQR